MLVQTPSQPETGTVSDPSTAIQDNYSVAWKFLEVISLQDFQSVDLTNKIMHSNVIREMYMISCYLFIQSEPSRFHTSFWRSFTCLARLQIHKCDTLVPWPEMEFENLNCLKFLGFYLCENFTGKPQTIVPPSSSRKETLLVLEDLQIFGCPKLQEFPTNFKFLKRLFISNSPQFMFFPEGFETLTSLESLNITQCENLQSLPPTVMSSLPDGMEKLTALKEVIIGQCPKIDFFPGGLQQRLNQLEFLQIYDCPDLARRCKKGEYRHLVSEIPKIRIHEEQGFTFHEVIKYIGLAIGSSIKKTFTPCGSTRQLNTTLPDVSYWYVNTSFHKHPTVCPYIKSELSSSWAYKQQMISQSSVASSSFKSLTWLKIRTSRVGFAMGKRKDPSSAGTNKEEALIWNHVMDNFALIFF
ncbi:Disease resistance protein RGA2 [Carex littledalei]|uniref:Disease resistance protein RGA2 n=1 Tax=Carex littledalei TaxID=544730 RepID=A0A833RRE3_9POAL|nr:Disease resistance protein RGA2 [Carex littledalei]